MYASAPVHVGIYVLILSKLSYIWISNTRFNYRLNSLLFNEDLQTHTALNNIHLYTMQEWE